MYPLYTGRRHDRPEHGEVLVHELAAVALDGNVSHSLVLHLLLVFATPRPPPPLSLRHLLHSDAAILHRGGRIQPPPLKLLHVIITLQQGVGEVVAAQILQAAADEVVLREHHCL